jgi:hypothetical protein
VLVAAVGSRSPVLPTLEGTAGQVRRRYIHVEDIEALERVAEETSLQDS